MVTRYEADSRAGRRGRGDTVTDTVDTVIGSSDRFRMPSRETSISGFRLAEENMAGIEGFAKDIPDVPEVLDGHLMAGSYDDPLQVAAASLDKTANDSRRST